MSQADDRAPRTGSGPSAGYDNRIRAAFVRGALLVAVALAGCSGETGTEVVPGPADLVQVSSSVDSVEVGQTIDPPMAVRVENSLGEPVEGVPVRFLLASGPGDVSPNLQVSNEQGIAETGFETGSKLGTSRIRVDVPSATNVPSLRFELATIPAGEVHLEVAGGTEQQAEVRSQLPLPFQLRATTPSGTPTAGVGVAWTLVDSANGARLGSDTTFTSQEGRTENLLTLGDRPVDHRVRAWALGEGLVTDTVEFGAAALTELSGDVRLDSVSPSPLRAGDEAVLYGEGFGLRAENVEVRVEGVPGSVVGVEEGRVSIEVPELAGRCLPDRSVGVRLLVRGEPSNGLMPRLEAGHTPLDLAVGETRILQGEGAADCLQIPASEQRREYLLTAGTASRSGGSRTPLRLLFRAEADSGEAAATVSADTVVPAGELDVESGHEAEGELRSQALSALDRRGLERVTRASRQSRADVETVATARTPEVGDTTRFSFAVGEGLSVSCEDTSRVLAGVTRAVGERVLLVEDTLAPSDGFGGADWERLRDEFDEVVFPTDSAYFGGPADLDGNGRVIVLFTPRVNQLSSRSSAGRVGGFFLPLDLVDSGDSEGSGLQGPEGQVCPASNEGEVLYVAAPDPAGEFSRALDGPTALRLARTITTHELMHLLSAQQRLVRDGGSFDQLGATWLQEGLAHLAEEVVGLRLTGLSPGQNLTWEQVAGDRERLDLFNTFHLNNFTRLNLFLLDPAEGPTLSRTDPGGLEGLRMRGFSWGLLRWLVDRHAAGDEEALTRRLSRGGSGHARGVDNVIQAVEESWDQLLTDFLLAVPMDDVETEGEATDRGIPSWHLPSVFEALSQNPGTRTQFPRTFPLQPTRLGFGNASVEFEASASSGTYVRLLDPGDGHNLAFRLSGQDGASLPASVAPVAGIVRLR